MPTWWWLPSWSICIDSCLHTLPFRACTHQSGAASVVSPVPKTVTFQLMIFYAMDLFHGVGILGSWELLVGCSSLDYRAFKSWLLHLPMTPYLSRKICCHLPFHVRAAWPAFAYNGARFLEAACKQSGHRMISNTQAKDPPDQIKIRY